MGETDAPTQLGLGLNLSTKKTRKREFLDEMDRVVPWSALVQIVEPHSPRAKTGRPPFAIETMLGIHYLHAWTRRLLQVQCGNVKLVCVHVFGLLGGQLHQDLEMLF